MAYNSFYTRQAQEDALVTQITNPNRVGSGFINLGPQKRFAESTANWQLGGGGAAPKPFTDIQNAPRPSSNGLPPPPVAQKSNALQASTPSGSPMLSPPPAQPNAQPIGKSMQPTSEAAPRQARAARFDNKAKNPPQPPPTNRMAHPGGKIASSNKDAALTAPPASKTKAGMPLKVDKQRARRSRAESADAPAAVPVEDAAAVAAQLAEDEALARQLQEQMLQQEMLLQAPPAPPELVAAPPEPVAAPPEPVAAPPETATLAEQGADAADRVAPAPLPASKTPAQKTLAPSEATTGDATSKRVRALRKKVRDIDLLEERQREGAVLQQDQLDKIAGKAAIVKELGALLV